MMKKIYVFLCMFLLSVSPLWSYEISQKDEKIIENFEDELFELIDTSETITPEAVVTYINYLKSKSDVSSRHSAMLEIIADDVAYSYYLPPYEDDMPKMTASDCYADEYYDSEDEMCYLKKADGYTENPVDYSSGKETHAHTSEEIEAEQIVASYTIQGDKIVLVSGKNEARHDEIWEIFSKIIPLSARDDFKMYHIVDDSASDTGAFVEQDSEDHNKWNMTVNLDAFYVDAAMDVSYVYQTLIHEFAHVLTLSSKQVRYFPRVQSEAVLIKFEENCTTNLVGEGCLYETAYLDDFIDTYWTDSEYLEKVRNGEINAYEGNEDNFVTDYAATNPGEDIAESFTYFVLKQKASGDSLADKKINFFYDYTSLVNLRERMRMNISLMKN